ncbi:MAG: lipid-binding SYLF domain-containing protein [Psychromonas sp.]
MFKIIKKLRFTFAILAAGCFILVAENAMAETPLQQDAQELIQLANQQLNKLDQNERWASVKNTTGIAKAIFVMPKGGQVGALLGAQWATGILMTRNEHQWSDPVFVKMNSAMLGLVIGGQSSKSMGIILDSNLVNNLADSSISVSGTADLTIFKGVSGKVVGGTGGISTLMIAENKGLYFGGSIDTFNLRLAPKLNQALYGEAFQAETVLNQFGESNNAETNEIKQRLARIGEEAVYGKQGSQ